jgi:decaprenyl-phosphate phosphoribosyltransferase
VSVDPGGPGYPSGIALEPVVDVPAGGAPSGRTPVPVNPSPGVRWHALARALRPRQWIKNLLVFVAPAAAGELHHWPVAWRASVAFVLFCPLASGLYLLNDAVDAEADRVHPRKRHRPIASGAVSERLAVGLGGALVALSVAAGGLVFSWQMAVVMGTYAAITLAYTLRLKREPVIELAAVASGFVLRAIAGGVATHVPLSSWFLVVVSFGALFVVTGKRMAEHRQLGEDRGAHRASLELYTTSFLQSTLVLSASVTATTYCLWAFQRAGALRHTSHHEIWIQLTVVPVVLGLLYVLRLLDAGQGGAPEELVLKDHFLQLMAVAWVALFAVGLYA